MGVEGSLGRAGAGLVGVVVAALLSSGVPASADNTTSPSPSPTASPTASPAGSPAGSPTGEPTKSASADPAKADDAAKPSPEVDAHDTAALIEATQALVQAQADLVTARADLTTAQTELAGAKAADEAAQVNLDLTAMAEQRAVRDLAAVEARIVAHQTDLGRLASSAYRSNGILGEWSLVLGSDTPNQLADRLATLHSVASAGNAMIASLDRDRADLTYSQAHLAATREAMQTARETAHQAVLDKAADLKKATLAEQHLAAVVSARAAALTAAQHAASADHVQYETMLGESGALSQRISDLAAKLAKGKQPPQGTGHMDRPGLGVITSPYGLRMHPILHYVKVHTGIDFAAADGISYAADDGVVLLTEFNVAYGNMTVIDHGTVGGVHMTTLYAHQAAFAVHPGDRVFKGQPIGVIGETGYATGPHLHFEVRINGRTVDPAPYLVDAPLPPSVKAARRPTP